MVENSTELKSDEPNMVKGSYFPTLMASILITVLLAQCGHSNWAWGFGVGAGISVFSLLSLGTIVPMLMFPSAPGATQFLLSLVMILKLPLYVVALYVVTRMPGADARSAFPGILMAPAVIASKTFYTVLAQAAG